MNIIETNLSHHWFAKAQILLLLQFFTWCFVVVLAKSMARILKYKCLNNVSLQGWVIINPGYVILSKRGSYGYRTGKSYRASLFPACLIIQTQWTSINNCLVVFLLQIDDYVLSARKTHTPKVTGNEPIDGAVWWRCLVTLFTEDRQ